MKRIINPIIYIFFMLIMSFVPVFDGTTQNPYSTIFKEKAKKTCSLNIKILDSICKKMDKIDSSHSFIKDRIVKIKTLQKETKVLYDTFVNLPKDTFVVEKEKDSVMYIIKDTLILKRTWFGLFIKKTLKQTLDSIKIKIIPYDSTKQ